MILVLAKRSSACCTFRQLSQIRLSHGKTPVQDFGYEYLKRQIMLKRPLSPHLTIYKPQMTWSISGLHRFSGCLMGGTLLVGGVLFAFGPDFTTFIETIRGWNLPAPILAAFKFIIALPMTYYAVNEVRMLGFDLAKGTDIATVYKTAYVAVALSLAISLFVVLNAKRHPPQQKSQKGK